MSDKQSPGEEAPIEKEQEPETQPSASQPASEKPSTNETLVEINALTLDETLVGCEQFYDLLRRTAYSEALNDHLKASKEKDEPLNVNEILKNGDTLLCMACSKAYEPIVKTLVEEFEADVNLCRSLTATSTSFSTITPTISISARRQSRLIGKKK